MKKWIAVIVLAFVVAFAAGCSERVAEPRIVFDSKGGNAVAEREKTAETFPVSVKDGFRIEGWYKDENYIERVVFPYTATKDVTLYAKWTDTETGSEGIEYERTEDGKGFAAVAYREKSYSVCIPDEHLGLPVTTIGNGFMKNRAYVGLFFIGKNVTQIDEEFYRCVSLVRFEVKGVNERYAVENDALVDVIDNEIVAYPRGLQTQEYSVNRTVGKNAFTYNSSIKKLSLGEKASADEGAFSEMTALESFSVNEDNGYFSSANGILYSKDRTILYKYPCKKSGEEATIPDSVKTVKDGAFSGAEVRIITLGTGVERYEDYSYTPNLTEYRVKQGNEFYKTESGLLYGADGKILYRVPQAAEGEVTVADGTETVSNFAFSETKKITSVFLPESVKNISDFAFYYCMTLKTIRFAEESEAETVSGGAFVKCESLEKLVVTSRRPPETDGFDCNSFADDFKIVVPDNAEEAYGYFWSFAKGYLNAEGRGVAEYSVTFETYGGTETESFHGLFVEEPVAPKKDGMIFAGWYDNPRCFGEKAVFPFVTEDHITLYACWEQDINASPAA